LNKFNGELMEKKQKNKKEEKGEKILIPLIAREQLTPEFVEKSVKGVKEIILLLVIDTTALSQEFGFATSQIRQGTTLLEDVKHLIGLKKKKVIDIIEWGDTVTKIDHISRLQRVDRIVMKKYDNQYWKELYKKLKNVSDIKIEIL